MRAEGPAAHEDLTVDFLLDPADRGAHVLQLVYSAAMASARAHDATEVERNHGEPPGGQLVADRPEERVVLAPAELWMRMADDCWGPGLTVRKTDLTLQGHSVFCLESDSVHVTSRRNDAVRTL